jgi:tetratricopeptide (TPR) repeat protein
MKYARNVVPAIIAILIVILCVPSKTCAQHSSNTPPNESILSDPSFIKGIEAMHNLDFETSRVRFEEVKRRFSDHSAAHYYLAANLFLQTLTQPSHLLPLLANLSRSSTFGENKEKVDQVTVDRFRVLTRQADQLAKARLKSDARDALALYFLGATHGLNAAFKGTLEGSIVSAMREGSSAVDKHRDVIQLNPEFHDAELSIGLYDYTVGALPLAVKIMAAIANIRGSKKRGLETLERVGRDGRLERHIARLILITLYKREKRYAEAVERARELTASYPRSYLFRLAEADALVSQAAEHRRTGQIAVATSLEGEALAIFDSLLKREPGPNLPAPPGELIHFVYGEALLKAGLSARAAQQFMAATSRPRADTSIVTIAHLRGAQAFDLARKRREALAQYEIVMKRPDVYKSRDRAAQGLRKPYQE